MNNFFKKNWFKLGILTVITLMGLSVVYYYLYSLPQMNIKAKSSKEDLALQETCSKKAKFFFEESGYPQQGNQSDFYQYTCHYNKKLNKCFISIRGALLGGPIGNAFYLYDTYENKMYADYYKTTEIKSGVKLEDTPPQSCSLLDRPCHSKEEYDTFIKPYIEE